MPIEDPCLAGRTEPTEVELTAGDARLAVDLRGGGLRRLTVGDWDVLDGYPAGRGRRGPAAAACCCPGPTGSATAGGRGRARELQLDVALARARRHAIHGLVAWQPWYGARRRPRTGVTVGTVGRAAPGLSVPARRRHRLRADRRTGSTVTVRVRNVGDDAAPFGVGMHPYLAVGADEDGGIGERRAARCPARTALGVDDGGLPTGERRAVRRRRRPDRRPRASTPRSPTWTATTTAGRGCGCAARPGELELAVDGAWPWLQVYSGDTLPEGQRRRSLAVEPMTCPPNALADGVDLRRPRAGRRRGRAPGRWPGRRRPDVRVLELWRYPVKSLQGERLTEAGDRRRWASPATAAGRCSTATPASASPPAGCPSCCSARPGCAPDGGVEVVLPDGTVTTDDAVLSGWLGRRVELRARPETSATRPDLREPGGRRGARRPDRVARSGRARPARSTTARASGCRWCPPARSAPGTGGGSAPTSCWTARARTRCAGREADLGEVRAAVRRARSPAAS